MKKVINILNKRKSDIDKGFGKMPKEVDQYIDEIAAELQEEERQIDQALLVLSNVVGLSEQSPCDYCGETKPLKYCQDCWDKLEQFKQCY
jgi:hypothetical protein